jgi:hypothetical protein
VNADLPRCPHPNLFCGTEKERIEAQVKAAEAAAQFKFDEEMRMKRERERKAARLALHMVLAACQSFLTDSKLDITQWLFNLSSFCIDEEDC